MRKIIFLALIALFIGAVSSWAGIFENVPWYTSWGDTPSTIYSTWTWHFDRDDYIKGQRCTLFHNSENNIVMYLEYDSDNELVGTMYYTEDATVSAAILAWVVKHYGEGIAKQGGGIIWTNVPGEILEISIDKKGMSVFEDAK